MKRTALALFLILTLFAAGGQALAAQTEPANTNMVPEIAPRLLLISYATPSLSVSGTTATYSLIVQCLSTVTKINATLQIQKQNSDGTYSNYGSSWTASSSSSYLSTSGTKAVASGGTYRLQATITVSGGGSETVTVYS